MKGTHAIRRSIVLLLLCTIVILYTKMRAYMHTTGVYFCNTQSYVNSAAIDRVMEFVHTQKNNSAIYLAQALPLQFNWIEQCSVQRDVDQSVYVDLTVAQPDFALNATQVVAHKRIINTDIYTPEIVDQLAVCTLPAQTTLSDDKKLIAFLYALPPELWQNYQLLYHTAQDIQLRSKGQKYIVRCSADRVPTLQSINTCVHILEKQKMVKGIVRVADIRFKDQLILYAHNREIQ